MIATRPTAAYWIDKLNLTSHIEGGAFREVYRSELIIPRSSLPLFFQGARSASTSIYFLLSQGQFSAFHRIAADELWHFYSGTGLHIYVLHDDGRGEVLKLGDDLGNGYSFQQMVPAGCWFASKPVHENGFSFVGCTVAPGFDFADFELGEKDALLRQYPNHKDWIDELS